MRLPRLLATLLVPAMLATACAGGEDAGAAPASAPTRDETAAPPSPSPSPSPSPVAIAPLTGEGVADPEVTSRPVLSVKIENTAAARPQAGLEQADVVYEELVEGGVTRFLALFQSEVPDVVGPVRSARLVDVDVLPSYRGVLAYSGAREEVTAALRAQDIPLLVDDGGDAFFRDPGRSRSHDLMARGPRLFEKAAGRDGVEPATPVFTFAEEPPAGAVACPAERPDCGEDVDLPLSSVAIAGWRYDAADGTYRREQNGQPSTVVGPGRIGAANVVALGMRIGTGGCCDGAGSSFVTTEVVGEGPAVVLRDGRRYDVTWRKTARTADLELLTRAGEAFPLRPGPTWIHLGPESSLPR